MRRLAAITAVVPLLLVGCGGAGEPERITTPGAEIEVSEGEGFEIVLDSNPTTGYEWRLRRRPNRDVVRFNGSSYEPSPGAEDLEGAGGQQTLGFEAVTAGETTIELEYVFGDGDERREPAAESAHRVLVR